jgi:hypothetical protein
MRQPWLKSDTFASKFFWNIGELLESVVHQRPLQTGQIELLPFKVTPPARDMKGPTGFRTRDC